MHKLNNIQIVINLYCESNQRFWICKHCFWICEISEFSLLKLLYLYH